MAKTHDISMKFKRGDTFKRDVQLTDSNNDNLPIPITDWDIRCQLRYGNVLAADVNVEITDAAAGEFTLSMASILTETLNPRTYHCDVEFYLPDVSKVSSQTFHIIVEKDVTFNA